MATKTTGGGLLGRADTTLVQGAYRAEMANVGRDMSGVYRLEAQNISNLQTAIEDIFYATNKSNNELYNDIKEKSSLILADIESGTFSDDTSIDLYTNAINDLREQAKSIPKGKKGEAQRAKIRAQLAKMKVDSANGEGVITEIATLINNDQISKDAITENDLKLFDDILNQKAKREIINGELVYSTVDKDNNIIKINHNELNKRFIKKDYSVENAALKLSSGYTKIGQSGVAFDFDEAVNAYEKIMTTREGFLHLINKPFGTMKISFAQALQGKDAGLVTEMISALNNIGGVDIDNDGTPDQITKDNYKKLADVLINPDAANLSIAKRAAAAFYADRDGRAQHLKGKKLYDAKQPSTPGFNESGVPLFKKSIKVKKGGDNNYESAAVATRLWKGLSNGLVNDPVDNTEYRWLGDGWYVGDDKKFDTTDGLVNEFGIQDDRFYGINPKKVEKDMRDPNTVDTKFGTGSDITIFNTGNDDTISNEFNKLIFPRNDIRNPDGLHFMPSGSKSKFGDNLLTQSITLYDKFDNKVQLNGKDVTFKVGGLSDGQKEVMLEEILEILDNKKVLSNDDAGLE